MVVDISLRGNKIVVSVDKAEIDSLSIDVATLRDQLRNADKEVSVPAENEIRQLVGRAIKQAYMKASGDAKTQLGNAVASNYSGAIIASVRGAKVAAGAPPSRRKVAPATPEGAAPEKGKEEKRIPAGAVPKISVSPQWLRQQLGGAKDASGKAATEIHQRREYIKDSFGGGFVTNTTQQEAVRITFAELYKIDLFRQFLQTKSAEHPELFGTLESSANRTRGSLAGADYKILESATSLMRAYLFHFIADPKAGDKNYRTELLLLPDARDMLNGLAALRPNQDLFDPQTRITVGSHQGVPAATVMSLPIDPDTITATALYVRRNAAGNRQLQAWVAPDVIPLRGGQPAAVATGPVAPTAPPITPLPAAAGPINLTSMPEIRIGIVGDSLSGNKVEIEKDDKIITGWVGTYSGYLEKEIRRGLGSPAGKPISVSARAIGGEITISMRRRFQADLLDPRPPYNIIVVQGGINDLASDIPPAKIEANLNAMYEAALRNGRKVVALTVGPFKGHPYWKPENQKKADEINTWIRKRAAELGIPVVDLMALGGEGGDSLKLLKEFNSGDSLHYTPKAWQEIAYLIGEGAFGIARPATAARPSTLPPQKSPLEDFAEKNWQNLGSRLGDLVKAGNVFEATKISRNLPKTEPPLNSLEEALEKLKRPDLTEAFAKAFNEQVHKNNTPLTGFIDFAKTSQNRKYSGVARASVVFSERLSEEDRTLIVNAVRAYINWRARDDKSFREDLQLLRRSVMQVQSDILKIDGKIDMELLLAMALYAWRQKPENKTKTGQDLATEFTRALGVTIVPPQTLPAQPAEQKGDKKGRRGTIIMQPAAPAHSW